jgi:hypothetical protein
MEPEKIVRRPAELLSIAPPLSKETRSIIKTELPTISWHLGPDRQPEAPLMVVVCASVMTMLLAATSAIDVGSDALDVGSAWEASASSFVGVELAVTPTLPAVAGRVANEIRSPLSEV